MRNWCAGRRPPPTDLPNLQGAEADTLARGGGPIPEAVGASRGTPQDCRLRHSNEAAVVACRPGNTEEEEEEKKKNFLWTPTSFDVKLFITYETHFENN